MEPGGDDRLRSRKNFQKCVQIPPIAEGFRMGHPGGDPLQGSPVPLPFAEGDQQGLFTAGAQLYDLFLIHLRPCFRPRAAELHHGDQGVPPGGPGFSPVIQHHIRGIADIG